MVEDKRSIVIRQVDLNPYTLEDIEDEDVAEGEFEDVDDIREDEDEDVDKETSTKTSTKTSRRSSSDLGEMFNSDKLTPEGRKALKLKSDVDKYKSLGTIAASKKAIATARREEAMANKAEFELRRLKKEQADKYISRTATFGGVPATARKGGVRDMYLGKPSTSLYVPPTPRSPTEIGLGAPAAEALRPEYSALRRAGSMNSMSGSKIAQAALGVNREDMVSPGSQTFARLREVSMPRGLSKIEQAAYSEIKENGDVDTLEHVKSQLEQLGISRQDTERAVKGLLNKGAIRQSESSQGEPAAFEVLR